MVSIIKSRSLFHKYWDKKNRFKLFDNGFFNKKNNLIVTGRSDDVVNVRGHRIGSAEIESIVQKEKGVAEVSAVAKPDLLEGNKIYLSMYCVLFMYCVNWKKKILFKNKILNKILIFQRY